MLSWWLLLPLHIQAGGGSDFGAAGVLRVIRKAAWEGLTKKESSQAHRTGRRRRSRRSRRSPDYPLH